MPLERFDWLEHSFGTRHSDGLAAARPYATLKQIHSSRCVEAHQCGYLGRADALVTAHPGILVGVRTADCLPVLLVEEATRSVAAIHAGWRGIAQGVTRSAVNQMRERYGASPAVMQAAIGPGIGVCCYEVGSEVAAQFECWYPDVRAAPARLRLNLAEIVRRQLLELGIAGERIYGGAPCTFCSESDFFSYRRDHLRAGRMISVIGVRA